MYTSKRERSSIQLSWTAGKASSRAGEGQGRRRRRPQFFSFALAFKFGPRLPSPLFLSLLPQIAALYLSAWSRDGFPNKFPLLALEQGKQATALAAAAVHRARLSNFLLAASPSPIFPSQESHEGREGHIPHISSFSLAESDC